MSADEKMKVAGGGAGHVVAFVGGPDAGRARKIPDEDMNKLLVNGDWAYRVVPFNFGGKTIHFAFDAQEDPLRLLFAMWEEYSIAAQIRGGDYQTHIKRLGDNDIKSRS